MKERIFLCLLLATVSLLCSCSEQRYVPPNMRNPNFFPVGIGFGFFVYIKDIAF